LVERP